GGRGRRPRRARARRRRPPRAGAGRRALARPLPARDAGGRRADRRVRRLLGGLAAAPPGGRADRCPERGRVRLRGRRGAAARPLRPLRPPGRRHRPDRGLQDEPAGRAQRPGRDGRRLRRAGEDLRARGDALGGARRRDRLRLPGGRRGGRRAALRGGRRARARGRAALGDRRDPGGAVPGPAGAALPGVSGARPALRRPGPGVGGVNAERRRRAAEILDRLATEHPDASIALHWSTPLELLVATILSAQSTDVGVNRVTETLFRRFRTPEDYLAVPVGDLEMLIKPTG